jgi:hypothetical protein
MRSSGYSILPNALSTLKGREQFVILLRTEQKTEAATELAFDKRQHPFCTFRRISALFMPFPSELCYHTYAAALNRSGHFRLPASFQESSMKLSKKAVAKPRPVVISSLAAKLLGHLRVADTALSGQRLSVTFPAFNSQELTNALTELLDKQLFKQKGNEAYAIYSLTDFGRDGRVSIA